MRSQMAGGALVELTMVLPILLTLTLVTVEIAQALAAYKALLTQVQSAARYLSTRPPGAGHVEATCLVTHGQASPTRPCTGSPLMPGFTAAGFSVSVLDAVNAPATHQSQRSSANPAVTQAVTVNLVTVTASGYAHPLIFATVLSSSATIGLGSVSFTFRQAS